MPNNEIINIASGETFKTIEIIRLIEKILNKKINLKIIKKINNKDISKIIINNNKLKKLISFKFTKIKEAINYIVN